MIAQRAVELIDRDESDRLYRVFIRLAGMWVYDIWKKIQSDIIYNCCINSGIV